MERQSPVLGSDFVPRLAGRRGQRLQGYRRERSVGPSCPAVGPFREETHEQTACVLICPSSMSKDPSCR
jgi:hypothetical protein